MTALLFAPWSSKSDYSRDAINQALYHDRLREIHSDIANESERSQLVEDLQHTLLQDIPGSTGVPQRLLSRWVLLPGIVLLAAVSLSVFWHTA
ncbi:MULTISPECIES: c-type cytochrome biogenesis protein CcmI [Symbiopectobacterium]|uniref:c-type cytochrome biogenesis protein CcmI n=1 Tax=Symbiopectobacterium TaxID=801 RepID=UPI00207A908E|nr:MULTISPECIES: c-type cytochrome biogenesis protein CcmI [Symbiopectobacterium]